MSFLIGMAVAYALMIAGFMIPLRNAITIPDRVWDAVVRDNVVELSSFRDRLRSSRIQT